MSEKEIIDITDLKQDTRNANKGTERGQLMVNNSIKENGAGRSVLVDRRGNIIAGNKTTKAATIAGLDVQIVRTDGTKLIAVMREDLDIDSPEARRLAIADNRASEVGLEWDGDELSALIADGVDVGGMFEDFELEDFDIEDADWGDGFDKVPSEDRAPFQQMTFTLHDSQIEKVKEAMGMARAMGAFDSENENGNGNALARICETFITNNG